MLFVDMEYSFRMYVLQKFTLSLHAYVDCVYQVAVFDGHDLMVQIHKNDLFGIVLDAQLSFGIVHDVINSIQLSSFDLLCPEIDFEAPEYEALLLVFVFFKKHVDDVLDAGRYSKQFFVRIDGIVFLQLLLDQS